ncbi:FAD-binding protein [Rubrobacter tropicus]|uniref:FAD-binding protein n=1 Tax=Rubrobacter tropicus TaxID=2653851 RepID=A0A6G8Q649_9ACTN|nr:FAD-binding oxidoreductase [Rubrobacter tropicus]QIN81942.1 FAD-binding protein [Rubrobacter tropicus]
MAEMRVVTLTGADASIEDSLVERFGAGLRGEAIQPTDAAYEEARRIWSGLIDRRPALIVRCAGVGDVVDSVDFAREHDLLVAVRGGGHNVAGNAVCDGGLVIDLSPMKGIRVDAERRAVRAEAGATLGDLDRETQVFGLATPLGVVSETGIAGLTLGGGIGWLRRKHGLSSDNLLSVDVVTADGRLLTASETENADLFWGIRGGGGNFGVVTSFEYRLHPVGPEVTFCFVLYPGDRAKEVLRFCDEYAAQAPDEVSPLGVLGRVPRVDLFPENWHGEQFVALLAMHPGGAEEGERALRPLRDLGAPIADLSARMPYTEAQKVLDEDYPDGWHYYWKSVNVDGLEDEVIERLVQHAENAPSDYSTIDVWYQGGAMGRVGADESAFGDRSAPILLGIEANWEAEPKEDGANIVWVRDCFSDMRRFSSGGMYLNFPGFLEEGDGLLRGAFGENYERLVALKNRYDPTNLFRLNQNIKPTA